MLDDKNKIAELKKAIISVIVFFDMFDYPLTLYEIWQFISLKCELIEVFDILENKLDKISLQNGFYFLSGKEKNIKERMERYNFTDRKFKKAMFIAKIFKFIPWIKMIAIGNLLGAHNLKDNSDIDLFIITDNKRIWITRFFCVSIIKLLGLRPSENNRRDKICLSFYVSLSALNLEKLRLDENDLYFVYWLAGLTPIYDKEKTYKKFIQANKWIKIYLPNWNEKICSDKRTIKSKQFLSSTFLRDIKPSRKIILSHSSIQQSCGVFWKVLDLFHNIINLFLNYLEKKFKVLQLKLLPQKLKSMMNRDSRVVINDQIIKLHSNDRREEYMNKMTNFR